jgi:hypothetical protein
MNIEAQQRNASSDGMDQQQNNNSMQRKKEEDAKEAVDEEQAEQKLEQFVFPVTALPGYEWITSYQTIMIGLHNADHVDGVTERSRVFLVEDRNNLDDRPKLVVRLEATDEQLGSLKNADSAALSWMLSCSDIFIDMHLRSGIEKEFFVCIQLDIALKTKSLKYNELKIRIERSVFDLTWDNQQQKKKRKEAEAAAAAKKQAKMANQW